MAQENHHLFSAEGVAKIRRGGCETRGAGAGGWETKGGSIVTLRSGMAAASIVPWTDLYEEEEEEEDGSKHLHISHRMGKQRYNRRSRIFSLYL